MIPAYIVKLVLPMVLDKLKDVISYVREPNELDTKVKKLEKQLSKHQKRLTKLESCNKCGGSSVG